MGKRLSKTNPNLVGLILRLKEASRTNEAPIWRDIALRLEAPSSHWAEVNISRLDRYTMDGDTVVIPGKLLGAGEIAKRVTVAAFKASVQARDKIAKAGGRSMSIEELVASNPSGAKVKVMR